MSGDITSLPLSEADRAEFVAVADEAFDRVLGRIEYPDPGAIRKLWDAGAYVDDELIKPEMLPLSRDEALGFIDAFLVQHVLGLIEIASSDPPTIH
jgi:hypothetical protein